MAKTKLTKEELNDAIRSVLPRYFEQAAKRIQENPPLRGFESQAPVTQQDLLIFMTAFQWALADAIVAMLGGGRGSKRVKAEVDTDDEGN